MKSFFFYFLILLLPLSAIANDPAPDAANWKWSVQNERLHITFELQNGYYAYAESTTPVLQPAATPVKSPKAVKKHDPILDAVQNVYPGPGVFTWEYALNDLKFPLSVSAEWQVCQQVQGTNEAMCLLPGNAALALFQSKEDLRNAKGITIGTEPEDPEEQEVLVQSFTVIRRAEGYMNAGDFLKFLRGEENTSLFSFAGKGILMSLILALAGGLLLNLTPCVLPLIPVNLAIIGASVSSGNPKKERIIRGTVYGAGIALTYGLLGIIAALTGTTFGQLDSSWIFNSIAALVFLVLGIAMFDVIRIDLSSFTAKFNLASSAAGYGGVFLMGALAAALAGACVAPVIAAAMLQAANLAAQGNYSGLLLPLLVGVGMALPWPFAAAGMTLFPKPGAWMNHVKHVLGILIIVLGCYYAFTAYRLLTAAPVDSGEKARFETINDALKLSAESGKTVLLDFGASWCKACSLMEAKTLTDPAVKAETENMIFRKIQAEDPSDPETAELLKTFQVQGLPAFLLIRPAQ